jgi:glycosyltransferase involved in cell wall biosynthesis
MRVVLVITKGEIGGAQTHVAELCGALRDRCEFLVLIGGSEPSFLRDALIASNVRVESIERLSNNVSPRSLLACVRQIADYARSWRADVIHVHSAVAGVVGRIAGRLSSIPVVYTVHGFAFKPEVAVPRRLCAFAAERLLAPLNTHTICVSPAELELARRRLAIPAERVSVISNGISDSPLRADPSREPVTIIMVARMAVQKRHDLLLEALRVLRARGIDPPRTLLAGDGPLMPALRQAAMASDLSCVNFCGNMSNISATLAQSQLFVLLSNHEGQPISIIEAMRAGLPVVASDIPGIRAQVTDGVEGLLTGTTAADVADVLGRLIGDPALRARMGAAARRRYETEFSATSMGERVARVYGQTVGKPTGAAVSTAQRIS